MIVSMFVRLDNIYSEDKQLKKKTVVFKIVNVYNYTLLV